MTEEKKKEKKKGEGRDPRFDQAWEERINAILRIESSQEKHALLGQIHDAEEVVEISYLMTLEDLHDMTGWSGSQGEGIDPPYHFRRIKLFPRTKPVPLPLLAIGLWFFFALLLVNGAPVGPTLLVGMAATMILIAVGATLAQDDYHKAGQCHQCGKGIDAEKNIKVLRLHRKEEDEKHYSHAGLCDSCEWVYECWNMWLTSLHGRLDLIFSKPNKIGMGRWRDPIPAANGNVYTQKDKSIPKNRDLNYMINKIDEKIDELKGLIKQMKAQKRRFRLG